MTANLLSEMEGEITDMDTTGDETEIVKVYRCHFCSQYIAAADQVIFTHVQLHVEYMGKDADGRYRCPIWSCPLQDPTPAGLAEHMVARHAIKRKARTDSAAYKKAVRFGIKTQEKMIKITEDRKPEDQNILQPRARRLDNRGAVNLPRVVNE